jgi:hypothetical protein
MLYPVAREDYLEEPRNESEHVHIMPGPHLSFPCCVKMVNTRGREVVV